MREKLSVLIPCKNERKNIRSCIESIRDLADEILVADSGSTDGTLEIVREIGGCRIIERDYVNHGNFVNWAMARASHEWVYVVDADERPTEKLKANIRNVLASPPEHIDAYWVSFICFFLGHRLRFSRWNTDALRLVRRDKCRNRECRVHPEFAVSKQRTGRLRGGVLHYSLWSYDDFFRKYDDYTKRVAHDRWDRGKRSGLRLMLCRPFLRFFYLYVLRLGFLDGAPGLQVCMLMAFFNTFVKLGRLWEMEDAIPQPDPDSVACLQFTDTSRGTDSFVSDCRTA